MAMMNGSARPATQGRDILEPVLCDITGVPRPNPMTADKVDLGGYLFYDKRLSLNGKTSCASCHKQELAFTDGRPVAIGITGEKHPCSAMSLVNVAYSLLLTWSNPGTKDLEYQALVPMFGKHPIEMGLSQVGGFLATPRADARYRKLFADAFPLEADPWRTENVAKALACFERSIISARSLHDRYHYCGDDRAVSDSAHPRRRTTRG